MLDVAHITFSYGANRILTDITFDVAPGEIVAVTGPNGAGKTTLIKILACLLMQDAGTVRLQGVDSLLRPVKYRRSIGYLSEHNPLYSDMTVQEYLTYRVRLKGERAMRVRRRVSEALAVSGLSGMHNTRIRLLSHGYRKRVSLADALSTHPKLLLLDDLLAGLDRPQRAACGAALSAASSRAAVVVTGHELDELLNWCTRVIVLDRGRIAALFRTSDFDRAELTARIDRLLVGQSNAQGVLP
ncbi:MAG: ABC transporter ATP-binding protein [Kiritimatiellae bacterium]|jgi:ABC-2 type transport system ATP-binding protein|nr:ABC transporter ATP-binding protein [Kiritimatiellia bacterium]NLG02128.1 ABC transporter ATP-binding protein [Lentisphaerota bacterium]